MFHHFHDGINHKKGPGSLSKDDLNKIIKFIGKENILSSDDFFIKMKENKLKSKDVCLTFDDGNLSQIDVALPVLEELKIKSFFFVYTSVFEKKPDFLEIYRYFRINFYEDINNFYKEFYKYIDKNLDKYFNQRKEIIESNHKKFPFYSIEDLKFRALRNEMLTKQEYHNIMLKMFKNRNFDYKDISNKIFLKTDDLVKINRLGHSIGLHSHTHPSSMEMLSYHQQLHEFNENLRVISSILNIDKKIIKFMSHPSGSYNKDTLKILKKLDIEIGFSNVMEGTQFNFSKISENILKINNSNLEICRQDSSQIMRMIAN